MKYKIFFMLAFCFLLTAKATIAQQTNTPDSDVEALLGYDPGEVLKDWIDWEQNQPAELAFLNQYMLDYQVPQSGLYGLNLHDTWYWWISNNQASIEDYIELKAQ